MATALGAPEPRTERPDESTDRRHRIDRWYDADAVTFRGGDEALPALTARIDSLRTGDIGADDPADEAERAGLPRR